MPKIDLLKALQELPPVFVTEEKVAEPSVFDDRY